jgi:chromosome segregation ATPase
MNNTNSSTEFTSFQFILPPSLSEQHAQSPSFLLHDSTAMPNDETQSSSPSKLNESGSPSRDLKDSESEAIFQRFQSMREKILHYRLENERLKDQHARAQKVNEEQFEQMCKLVQQVNALTQKLNRDQTRAVRQKGEMEETQKNMRVLAKIVQSEETLAGKMHRKNEESEARIKDLYARNSELHGQMVVLQRQMQNMDVEKERNEKRSATVLRELEALKRQRAELVEKNQDWSRKWSAREDKVKALAMAIGDGQQKAEMMTANQLVLVQQVNELRDWIGGAANPYELQAQLAEEVEKRKWNEQTVVQLQEDVERLRRTLENAQDVIAQHKQHIFDLTAECERKDDVIESLQANEQSLKSRPHARQSPGQSPSRSPASGLGGMDGERGSPSSDLRGGGRREPSNSPNQQVVDEEHEDRGAQSDDEKNKDEIIVEMGRNLYETQRKLEVLTKQHSDKVEEARRLSKHCEQLETVRTKLQIERNEALTENADLKRQNDMLGRKEEGFLTKINQLEDKLYKVRQLPRENKEVCQQRDRVFQENKSLILMNEKLTAVAKREQARANDMQEQLETSQKDIAQVKAELEKVEKRAVAAEKQLAKTLDELIAATRQWNQKEAELQAQKTLLVSENERLAAENEKVVGTFDTMLSEKVALQDSLQYERAQRIRIETTAYKVPDAEMRVAPDDTFDEAAARERIRRLTELLDKERCVVEDHVAEMGALQRRIQVLELRLQGGAGAPKGNTS